MDKLLDRTTAVVEINLGEIKIVTALFAASARTQLKIPSAKRRPRLSNRAYDNYDALLEAGAKAYRTPTPDVLKAVCGCPYLQRAFIS